MGKLANQGNVYPLLEYINGELSTPIQKLDNFKDFEKNITKNKNDFYNIKINLWIIIYGLKKHFFNKSSFITLPLGVSSANVTPPPSANSSSGVFIVMKVWKIKNAPKVVFVHIVLMGYSHCPSFNNVDGPGYFCIQDEACVIHGGKDWSYYIKVCKKLY